MAFQLSPGVLVSEVDLTTVVPSVATTVGGIAGDFQWGPVNQEVTIGNEIQLVNTFGKPDSNTANAFFTAANFLSYGNDLRVVRSIGANGKNAVSNGSAVLIANNAVYEASYSSNTSTLIYAKYPGALGSNLRIAFSDANNFSSFQWADQFDSTPNTSPFVTLKTGSYVANDEMHVVIIDDTGTFSGGVAGTVLEKFAYVSKASDAKNPDGSDNFYKNVINSRSKYLYWGGHPTANVNANTNWGLVSTVVSANGAQNTFHTISGIATVSTGSSGVSDAPTDGNLDISYDLFSNPESSDVSLLMTGATNTATVPNYLISIAESRKDCMVFVSPKYADVVNNATPATSIVSTAGALTKSSFAVMDSGWKYQYDKYNDVYRWVPLNGDIAGLCVRTDLERDPWFSPAGLQRGVIKNVIKLAWSPAKADRDTLYKAGVNPVVSFPGEGTVLYGDKTLQNRPSAFDRINVRRLFIILEKSIAKAARSSLFEFNDEFTRAAFVNLVEPYLRDIKGRRGIYDYKVICDTTNNTPEVIDQNNFVGDIYIKPARSINFIQLNFVAVRTGVSFEEIVGSV